MGGQVTHPDLADIDTTNVTPFIMNSGAWVAGDGVTKFFVNIVMNDQHQIATLHSPGRQPLPKQAPQLARRAFDARGEGFR